MVLTVEDNFITAAKTPEIRDKLLNIFQERFGYYVDIEIVYEETKKSRQAEYAEETFQREVSTIVKNYEEAEEAMKAKQAKVEEQKPARDFKKENTYVRKKIIDPDIFTDVLSKVMKCRFLKSMMKLVKWSSGAR